MDGDIQNKPSLSRTDSLQALKPAFARINRFKTLFDSHNKQQLSNSPPQKQSPSPMSSPFEKASGISHDDDIAHQPIAKPDDTRLEQSFMSFGDDQSSNLSEDQPLRKKPKKDFRHKSCPMVAHSKDMPTEDSAVETKSLYDVCCEDAE